MNQSEQLANRFKEVTLNGTWIANTNLKVLIKDVNLEDAIKQFYNLNTIAKLTFHLGYYISGVLQVLEGGTLDIKDKFSFDMPNLETENDWEALKQKVLKDAEQFALKVSELSDEQLQQSFVDEKYGNYQRNIDGMIEHCYYHIGQISLIRKIIGC